MTEPKQKILVCAPAYFGVDYVINPWMEGQRGATDKELARRQWDFLMKQLAQKAELFYLTPQPNVPDLVFTANAGLVLGKRVVVSRFHTKERQREEPYFHAWFAGNGFEIAEWPQNLSFEGAGDALFDRGQPVLWVGHGVRSDAAAPALLATIFGRRTVALQLVDPRFYHLDTCFCPLANGYLMYFPSAFDEAAQKQIAALVPAEKLIVVAEKDALTFACNAVELEGHVYMNAASTDLQEALKRVGFTPVITPLSEFMKAGGSAKCLTLKLVEA